MFSYGCERQLERVFEQAQSHSDYGGQIAAPGTHSCLWKMGVFRRASSAALETKSTCCLAWVSQLLSAVILGDFD